MARFVDTVMTSIWSEDDAFSYMSDARNFAEWDPGTSNVEQVRGDGGGEEPRSTSLPMSAPAAPCSTTR